MKQLFIRLFMVVVLVNSLFAVDEFNIYNAYDKAQRLNKPIYLLIASSKCSHCVTHIENTIKPNFKLITKDYVFALIDVVKEPVPKKLGFGGTTPTTYILSPKGEMMINPITGNFPPAYLHKLLETMYKHYGAN